MQVFNGPAQPEAFTLFAGEAATHGINAVAGDIAADSGAVVLAKIAGGNGGGYFDIR